MVLPELPDEVLAVVLLRALVAAARDVVVRVVDAGFLRRVPRSRPRRTALRDVGHVVDPVAAAERVVRAEVVRLPERARVGRDRDAADLHLVADEPRRERGGGAGR